MTALAGGQTDDFRSVTGACIRILFLEVTLSYRQLLADYLRQVGYEVVEVGDVDAFLRAARQHPPDIALVDLLLESGPSGFCVPEELKKFAPSVRTIALTILEELGDVQRAMVETASRVPFDGYVTKFSSREQIVEAIEITLRGGTVVDPRVGEYLTRAQIVLDPVETLWLQCKAKGLKGRKLADAMPKPNGKRLSARQIGRYGERVRAKLGVSSAEQAVAEALRLHLI